MRQTDLEIFAATKTNAYIEIVLDDGSIVVGKNFRSFLMGEKLNIWSIKPNDKVAYMVDGYRVKEIRSM